MLTGAGVAIALHAIVLFALLQLEPVRSAIRAVVPITVRLIAPPQEVVRPQVLPKPLPPKPLQKPRVHRPKPAPEPPVVAAVTEAPSQFVAQPDPPAPLPPIEVAPPPVAAAPAPIAAPPAPPEPVTPPRFNAAYLNNPAPSYPSLSRRMREEGRVVLRVYVSEQGVPTQIEVKTSSKHQRLDEAASSAVRQWRFVPARRGASPVGAWVLVPISFSLRS